MQNVNVFNLLDILVKMSNSKSNAETLNAELDDLLMELDQKETALNELTSSISDDKYFDASSEIVDRNIEISTSKKIRNLEHEIVEQRSNLSDLEETAQKLNEEILNLNTKINNFRSYLEVIELRKNSSQDEQVVSLYTQISSEEQEYLINLENDLEIKTQDYDKLCEKINSAKAAIEANEQNVTSEKQKLEEIQNNLVTKNAYINYALKEQDEQQIEKLHDQIDTLQTKIDEIYNNPAFIVNNIKEMIANNETVKIDSELNHLLNEIEKIPYMNINSDTKLDEYLEAATKKRDDFVSYIENKRYEGIDTPIIEQRIEYLKNAIIDSSEDIEKLKAEVKNIDTNSITKVKELLDSAEVIRKSINDEIASYEENEDNKTHKKAAVQASLNRKNSELKTINEIINAYLKDQRRFIENANDIETNKIGSLHNLIQEYETEINDLKKLLILKNKSKDVIEIEKDQEELQNLNTEIELINYRGGFKTTPRKIVADIKKMLDIDYSYHTSDDESDETLDADQYQEMLNTPDFSVDNTVEEFDNNVFTDNKKEEGPIKVINITPYENNTQEENNTEELLEINDNDQVAKEDSLWA